MTVEETGDPLRHHLRNATTHIVRAGRVLRHPPADWPPPGEPQRHKEQLFVSHMPLRLKDQSDHIRPGLVGADAKVAVAVVIDGDALLE